MMQEQMSGEDFDALTEDDRRIVRLMRSLRDNEGWQFLAEELQEQIEVRRNYYELDSNASFDTLVGREFMRGEIAMLRLILSLPEDVEQGSLDVLKARQRQYEESRNDGYDTADGGTGSAEA